MVDRSHHFSIEIANYSCNFYFKCFLFHTYLLLDSLPVNYNLKNKCFVNYNTLLDSCSIYCPFSSVTFFHFPSLYCLCSLGTNCVIVALTPSTAIMMDFIWLKNVSTSMQHLREIASKARYILSVNSLEINLYTSLKMFSEWHYTPNTFVCLDAVFYHFLVLLGFIASEIIMSHQLENFPCLHFPPQGQIYLD